MADFLIPVDKCYSANSSPINKNVINHINYTTKKSSLKNNFQLTEQMKLDYWIFDGNLATANSNFVLPSNLIELGTEENEISGDTGLTSTQKTYRVVRKSTIKRYSVNYKPDIGVKNNSNLFASTIYSQLFLSAFEIIEHELKENISGSLSLLSSYSAWQNYYNNIGTGSDCTGVYYIDYDSKKNTFTFYIALETQVIANYYQKFDSGVVSPDIAIQRKYNKNYALNFRGNVYSFDEDYDDVKYAQSSLKNDNVYTINNPYILSGVIIGTKITKSIAVWNADNILAEYSEGKKTINIEMPLLKLYNSNGDIVVDKEVLKVGQTFELTSIKNNKFSNYSNAMGKTFCIISVEFAYNGVGKMTIIGKEV